ncbi:hypothetical protein TNCV_3830071 [Trichonephila clavipes]|nr:hypothetical protein TNCV_3830071 [Trichonephila clavipes]
MESEYGNLLRYSPVGWISRDDKEWLCKLMFLTDITRHLNELNLGLQGKSQTEIELFIWKGTATKLNIFSHDINTSQWLYSPRRALAFSRYLLLATAFQLMTFEMLRSFSIQSIRLNGGLPQGLFTMGFARKLFLQQRS